MGLICNDREAAFLQAGLLLDSLQHMREGLDGDDDDAGIARQGLGQLGRLAAFAFLAGDAADHAFGVLELVDGLLQLGIEHGAVSDDDYRVEHPLVLLGVQRGKTVRRPGDGVGLARARAVLDQVTLPRPLGASGGHQSVDRVPLVEAREDQSLFGVAFALPVLLLFLLQVDEAAEDVEPGIALEDLLPKVVGSVAMRIRRITGTAFVALVEGQEEGVTAGQSGGHPHLFLADGKVHQGALAEGQQRLGFAGLGILGRAVFLVLPLGVVDGLLELGLQLQRRYRHPVDEQHKIQARVVAVAGIGRVGNFLHHAQTVVLVAVQGFGIQAMVRFELAEPNLCTAILEAVAQYMQRAMLVHLFGGTLQ